MTAEHNNPLPAELAPTARSLEALADTDRGDAPAGFEERLTLASLPVFLRSAGGMPVSGAGRWLWRLTGVRLAAGLALMGACAAAWLAVSAGGGGTMAAPTLEEELDTWMSVAFGSPTRGDIENLTSDAAGISVWPQQEWQYEDFDLNEGSL